MHKFRGGIEPQSLRPGSSACGGARAEGMPDRYQNKKPHFSAGFSFSKCEDVHDRFWPVVAEIVIPKFGRNGPDSGRQFRGGTVRASLNPAFSLSDRV